MMPNIGFMVSKKGAQEISYRQLIIPRRIGSSSVHVLLRQAFWDPKYLYAPGNQIVWLPFYCSFIIQQQ